MNIAITGGTGFLGLHLVRELLRDQSNALILLAHAGSGDAMSRVLAFLELTGAAPPEVEEARGRMRVVPVDVLFHVSTAFVAGTRIKGTVHEDELDHGTGFESPYEQSKYEAEVLVREWSARHDHPVTVLRPGILVTSRPPHPDLPPHPLEFVNRSFAAARRLLGLAGPRAWHELPEVRIAGCRDGHLNFMPVEAGGGVLEGLVGTPSGL